MMPLRIRRKGRGIEKLENPAAPQRRGRSFPREDARRITLASTRRAVTRNSTRGVSLRGLLPLRRAAKLLRGQALPDMSNSGGKIADYCGKIAPGRAQIRKLFRIGSKFLAVQRLTF